MKKLLILQAIFFCISGLSYANSVSLVFTGDIMVTPALALSLDIDEDILTPVHKYFNGSLNFANLEFTVNTNKPVQGYPDFNGSRKYLKYFTKYFNLFSVANNHVYDQGAAAQAQVMSFLAENKVLSLGGNTKTLHTPALITNINGVDILLTAYSTLDNGLWARRTNKSGAAYFMNFEPDTNKLIARIRQDLAGIPAETVKIVSLHYGLEYTSVPDNTETLLLRSLIEAGVDIVVGHHPHVPRRAEWYQGTNHAGVIMYSLGNFFTAHKNKYPYLDIGVIVRLDVGPKKQYSFSYTPTFTYFTYVKAGRISRVLPFEDTDKPPTGYTFTELDKQHISEGQKIIKEFFEPLTKIKQGINKNPNKKS